MTRAEARAVLGVRADADADAVRRAYRLRMRDAHPDRGGSTAASIEAAEARDALLSDGPARVAWVEDLPRPRRAYGEALMRELDRMIDDLRPRVACFETALTIGLDDPFDPYDFTPTEE